MSVFGYSLTFEVAFDVDVTGTPSGGDWTDLSDRLRIVDPITIAHGKPEGGRCTLALNNRDRALDPTNPSATLNLVPMRHARLRATADSTTHDLWTGFVEEWPPWWGMGGVEGVVHVTLVDGAAWLGLTDADVDLDAQLTGARVNALLDAAGWPAGLRDIDPGVVKVDPFARVSANLLRLLIDTADAEDGQVFVAPDGTFTFRDRHARLGSTVQLAAGTDIDLNEVTPSYGGGRLVNVASVEMADATVYELRAQSSIDAYGVRTEPIRDLPVPVHEAWGLADWTLWRWSEPHVWLDGLKLRGTPAQMAGLRMGDRVTFTHDPPGGGTAEVDGHVELIVHDLSREGWTVTVDLSPHFDSTWGVWHDDVVTEGSAWVSDEATTGSRWAP